MAPLDRRKGAERHQNGYHTGQPHPSATAPPPSGGRRAPEAPKDPINVLVIGPTQNGKSTFINKFLSMSRVQLGLAEQGNGFDSCTTRSGAYEVDMPTTSWMAVDASTNDEIDIPEDEEVIFSNFARRKTMRLVPLDPESPRVRLRLIDTPGLDDSKGRDAQNIQDVLRMLAAFATDPDPTKRYINVIVFIVSMHTAFSDSFQGFYRYYKRCMPNLFGGLAIINTNFTMNLWKTKASAYSLRGMASSGMHSMGLRSGTYAKNHIIKQRRTDFAHVLECDPRHFFIDSWPAERFPFEQLTTYNTMTEILHHFMAQGPMPIESMRFLKQKDMAAIDLRLANYMQTISSQWTREQEKLLLHADSTEKVRSHLAKEGRELDVDIEELQQDLERWNNDEEYKLNTYNTDDPSAPDRAYRLLTFQRIKNALPVKEHVAPFDVTRTDNSDACWTGKTYDPSSNTWTCKYEAKWRKKPNLTLQSWTHNRTYYAENITRARRQLRNKEAARVSNELAQAAQAELGDPSNDNPQAKRLGERISQCAVIVRNLKADELPLTEGMSKEAAWRYAKQLHKVGVEDLMDMLRMQDREFAQAAFEVIERPELKSAFLP